MRLGTVLVGSLVFATACGDLRKPAAVDTTIGAAHPDTAIASVPPDAGQADAPALDSGLRPTTVIAFRGNLSPDTVRIFDPMRPMATSNLSSRLDFVTTAGTASSLFLYFVYDGTGFPAESGVAHCWTYHALLPSPGFPEESGEDLSTGRLCFDVEGHLMKVTPDARSATDTAVPGIRFDFGHPTGEEGTGDDGVTGYVWMSILADTSVRSGPGNEFQDCRAVAGTSRVSPNCIPAPCPTRSIRVYGNLSPTAPIKTFSIDDPVATSNLATEVSVQTTMGDRIPANMVLSRLPDVPDAPLGANAVRSFWRYRLVCDGVHLRAGAAGKAYEVAGGILGFDEVGRLVSNIQDPVFSFMPAWGAGPQILQFDFGTPTTDGPGPGRTSGLQAVSEITRVDVDTCLVP